MDKKLLDGAISALVSGLIDETKDILKNVSDEGAQFLKTGLKKYLKKQTGKYILIKTLLKGNVPVYIYDIYYPLKLVDSDDVIKTDSVSNVFHEYNYNTIIGAAGSGKSTLVRHLFLYSIFEKYSIPVLIELRYLNEYEEDIECYINSIVLENKIAENFKIMERLLESGKFIFFLDGCDELSSSIKEKTLNCLSQFIDKYPNNKFILTTRPYSDAENLQRFRNLRVKELSLADKEIQGFVYKQLHDEKELAHKIVSSIERDNAEYISSFLTNPLLLSLYILTFQSNADIPSKKHIFYRRVIQALFAEHDSKTKIGFVREKHTRLKQEEFEDILKTFCFISYFESVYTWDVDYAYDKFTTIKKKKGIGFDNSKLLTDFKSALAIWIEDNGEYSFAHRSLQEYFAASFVKNLNHSESERVYKKIAERCADVRQSNEIENFLSLLEEMDGLNFMKYYKLPLLAELRRYIDNSSDNMLYESFVKFFSRGVYFISAEHTRHVGTDVNDEIVYKSIYFHLPYTLKLNKVMKNAVEKLVYEDAALGNNPKIKEEIIPRLEDIQHGAHGSKRMYVNFNTGIPQEFTSLCYNDALTVAREFDEYIDNEIASTRTKVDRVVTLDKEFVDLI